MVQFIADAYAGISYISKPEFTADQPIHVVRAQIRRHCRDLNFPSASNKKYFEVFADGKYYLLQSPFVQILSEVTTVPDPIYKDLTQQDLKHLHSTYLETFKVKVLEEIKKLDPYDFERFCRNLLKVYDFREIKVTQKSRDGGIDGYGKYKVGLTFINAAFQCKRWKSNTVGGKEIKQDLFCKMVDIL